MHFWPKFGNTDFNWWWLFARTSSKWGKFWLLSSIWPWSSRSIVPKNNRDLNQGLLHIWSKFGDSSLNGLWVIARTSWWLTDRHTHTQATTIPEGQNWPRVKITNNFLTIKLQTYLIVTQYKTNVINHYVNLSQTCQLLKILKNIFFSNIEKKLKSSAINIRLNWYRKSISTIERVTSIYSQVPL